MPLYEYQCESCGERIEVIQKFSDPPLTQCSRCGGEVSKLLSAPAIQFRGSGWYITDYARNGSSSNGSGNGSKSEVNSSGGDSEKPADSKPKSDSSVSKSP